MIGERIARARAASGLSMQALGDSIGVSPNMIKKYEHDTNVPTSSRLIALAQALNVRSEYFFRPVTVELQGIEYRKRANTPAKILKRVKADVLEQAERWQELANLWPNFPVQPFEMPAGLPDSIQSLSEIEAVANHVRDIWQLGLNPIPDVIAELESRGLLVIVTDVAENARIDGLQASVAGQPVIVVSAHSPGDRQRFTLAHELGHLILDGRLAEELDEEKACNRFASAWLLPAVAVKNHFGEQRHDIEARELYALKREFGVSMQGCLYRAKDLGVIDEPVYKRIFINFSKQGWRKHEPGEPYPAETTALFEQLVYRALGEHIIGEPKAAELLGLSKVQLRQARKLELLNAAAH